MFKRIGLFLLTNVAIIVLMSVIMSVFGIQGYFDENGLNYKSLMIFCLIWGFVGSFISLFISRWVAKKMTGVKLIEDGSEYVWLRDLVHTQARNSGISTMPEVGIFPENTANAFATGRSKNRALVAFSKGILRQMNRSQIEAVSAHEIGHIVNGDMVTMALIQGVVNAFVMFISRVLANIIANMVDEKFSMIVFFVAKIAGDILFSFLASIVTCWFSRKREFRADNFAGQISGRENMISALESLAANHDDAELPESVAALGISGKSKPGAIRRLFSTHPPLEERIAALRGHVA